MSCKNIIFNSNKNNMNLILITFLRYKNIKIKKERKLKGKHDRHEAGTRVFLVCY